MRRLFTLSLLAFASSATAEPYPLILPAGIADEWAIGGTFTLRAEDFSVQGNQANSPFGADGSQFFTDFDFTANRRYSPFNTIQARLSGVANSSDTRSNFRGVVPERGSVIWTNGEGQVPFRATAGDFFGFFSPRTVNTSLKGAMVEFQPRTELFGARHSLQAFAGARMQTFRDDQAANDEQHYGASWLMLWGDTALSLNSSRARLGGDISGSGTTEFQDVLTIAAETTFEPGEGHRILLDAEFGAARRDDGTGTFQDGFGGFMEARGTYGDAFYRLKAERYDDEFEPTGGSVQGDRQTLEAEIGARFGGGYSARIRTQEIRTNLTQGVEVNTRVLGTTISGGQAGLFGLQALNGSLDTFSQFTTNADNTVNTQNLVANLNMNLAFTQSTSATFGLLFDDRNDRAGGADVLTRQAQLGLAQRFDLQGFQGSANLGVTARDRLTGGLHDVDYGPNLALNGRKGPHRFGLNASLLSQRPAQAGADLDKTRIAATYDYSIGAHLFRLDARFDGRAPEGENTRGYQVGATYTFRFGKIPESKRRVSGPAAARPSLEDRLATARNSPRLDFETFLPGAPLDDAFIIMEEAEVLGAVPLSGAFVFEERYLENVFERQRFALVPDSTGIMLEAAAVLVTPDIARGADELEELLIRTQAEMTRLYGPPEAFEEGDFDANAFADIAAGRLIRLFEWRLGNGTLRLGLPQRLDGQVGLELQYRRNFPAPQDPRWSLDLPL
jgi:hypothetical protein